jgi:tetratricopeptide (TPR) repeat protein
LSAGVSPEPTAALQRAAGLMNQRRFGEAQAILQPLAQSFPGSIDTHFLLGAVLRNLGDAPGAERALRAALALDGRRADAAGELARLLASAARFHELLEVTDSFTANAQPAEALLVQQANALHALGRPEDSIAVRERIAALYPHKAAHRHNLAAALGDLGLAAQAEVSARAALQLRADAPETWLVLARALQSQNRFDAAEDAFRQAVRHRPDYADALRDHSQLVWMRTGNVAAARAILHTAGSAAQRPIRMIEARLLETAGDMRAAYAIVTAHPGAADIELDMMAAHMALGFDPQRALAHVQRAAAFGPAPESLQRQAIEVLMAVGRTSEALARIEALLAYHPLDQGLIAAQWTAWTLLGDPRADELYDYEAFVFSQAIDTPSGWRDLDAFLPDLAAALTQLHGLHTHPFGQSLRHGSQTSVNMLRSDDPAIRAVRTAIDGPIRRYLDRLGRGPDRVRSRNTGEYAFAGMWSVRLRPGGFHVDHTHPHGWLSSACHIEIPQTNEQAGREGWLKFGEPGFMTGSAIPATHFVEPVPGHLVMFPSYIWHGTLPFSTEGHRLSIAFDLIPV